MNGKSVLSLLLALLFCFTLFPTALAEEPEGIIAPAEEMAPENAPAGTISPTSDEIQAEASSGRCGDDLTWTLGEDGTLTISGTGDMWDFEDDPAPWYSKRSDIKTACLLSGITRIGNWAFEDCSWLTSVTIPGSVTSIGDWAFDCCSSLTSVTIPGSVTSIGVLSFQKCSSLTEITIPSSVTSIAYDAFSGCSSLMAIDVDEGNTVYSSAAGVLFDKEKAVLLAFPGGKGGSYVIPGSVTRIGDAAFEGCSSLTEVTIPGGVTCVGYAAFFGCSSLTSVTIPGSVTSIGTSAFQLCSRLRDIHYGETAASWRQLAVVYNRYKVTVHCSDGDIAPADPAACGDDLRWFLDAEGALTISGTGDMWDFDAWSSPWYSKNSNIKSVRILSGITSIGNSAFESCSSLSEITIPESVTSIGDAAFFGCSSLTEITIPESVTYIGENAFSYCSSLTEITIPESVTYIGQSAFSDCSSLTGITIPEGVISIGDCAFSFCSSLSGITLPAGVTSIGYGAFYGCSSLTNITIPDNVDSIEEKAFAGCSNLTAIRFSGSAPTFGEDIFQGVTATAYFPAKDPTWTASVRQNYSGTITWEGYVPGDATGDGELDLLDLVRLRKQLAGLSPELNIVAADLNGNWEIDLPDLVRLRILLVGEPD